MTFQCLPWFFVQSNGELPGKYAQDPEPFTNFHRDNKTFGKAKKLERRGVSLFDASLGWESSILA